VSNTVLGEGAGGQAAWDIALVRTAISACLLAHTRLRQQQQACAQSRAHPPLNVPAFNPSPPTWEARWLWQMTTPSGGLKPPPTSASHFSIWMKPLPAEHPDCLDPGHMEGARGQRKCAPFSHYVPQVMCEWAAAAAAAGGPPAGGTLTHLLHLL
jgi:hypothetical protein